MDAYKPQQTTSQTDAKNQLPTTTMAKPDGTMVTKNIDGTTTTTVPDSNKPADKLSTGARVGIVIAALVAIGGITALIVVLLTKKNANYVPPPINSPECSYVPEDGDLDPIPPA